MTQALFHPPVPRLPRRREDVLRWAVEESRRHVPSSRGPLCDARDYVPHHANRSGAVPQGITTKILSHHLCDDSHGPCVFSMPPRGQPIEGLKRLIRHGIVKVTLVYVRIFLRRAMLCLQCASLKAAAHPATGRLPSPGFLVELAKI